MEPSLAAGHTDYRRLAERMGRTALKQRIERQAGIWAREEHQGRGLFFLERYFPVDEAVARVLRLCGMTARGKRNALDLRLTRTEFNLPGLPAEFDGFTLLHLSDPHLDLCPELTDRILETIDGVSFDLAVLTGDYHNRIGAEADVSLREMARLVPHLGASPLAVLGNHDFIEKVAFLEFHGLRLLLNEAVPLCRGASRIWICGVDDPHFFGSHDLAAAKRGILPDETKILLCHSPEVWREAEVLGYHLMLCGHTHGGQICLPGGTPVVRNAPVPRTLVAGRWLHRRLQGYTSRGAGVCGVAARFNCPPEISLHVLRGARQ